MSNCSGCGFEAHEGPCAEYAQAETVGKSVLEGRYELIGLLGQGGMGTVYMARDQRLHNRPCVVKKLRDDFYREEDKRKAVAFFEREAGVLSQLSHPNIVHVLDYFEENYDYYLVMEYVEGSDLENVLKLRGEPFSEAQVLDWALQILDVLDYLHSNEPAVIYRDLKPSNIMIDVKNRVKLVDFGIARPCEDNADNTHVVSAGYSPPEQYWGAADPRSDLYALGATMFFLLTGKEPVALHPCAPAEINRSVSPNTNAVVLKATAQDPDSRYQTAGEMRRAFQIQPVQTLPLKPVSTRRKGLIELVVTLAIIGLASLALLAYQKVDEMLRAKQDQIKAKEELLNEEAQEKSELTQKLQAYSRAVQAQEKAILEWRDEAAKNEQSPASSQSPVAAQVAGEAQLTDPEGLAPVPSAANQQVKHVDLNQPFWNAPPESSN